MLPVASFVFRAGCGGTLLLAAGACTTFTSEDGARLDGGADGAVDAPPTPEDGSTVPDGPIPTPDGGDLCATNADFCDDFEAATTFLEVKNKWGDNSSDTAWGFMKGRSSKQAIRAQGPQVSPAVFEARLRHQLAAFSSDLDLRFDANVTSCEGCELARVAILNDSGGIVDGLVLTLEGGKLVPSRGGSPLGAGTPFFPTGRWTTVRLTAVVPKVTLAVDQGAPVAYSVASLTPGARVELWIGPYRTAVGAAIDVGYDNVGVRSR